MATQREFLKALFSAAYLGEQILLRTLPEGDEGREERTFLDPRDIDADTLAALPTDRHVFFGAATRLVETPSRITAIWADVDSGDGWRGEAALPAALEPTAVVLSGKVEPVVGYHAWFALDEGVEPERGLGLVRLARVLFGGDRAVVDKARVMRLPGTMNVKREYGAPRPVTLAALHPEVRYSAQELEERLIGAIAAKAWSPGTGHHLALGLGALLDRAGWPIERVKRAVEYSLEGAEVSVAVARSRVAAAAQTVERREQGHNTSSAQLRDALGQDDWKDVLKGLGITARDGDVLHGDEVVGKIATVEQDTVDLILGTGDWAWADGSLARWTGTHWRQAYQEELTSAVFGVMKQFVVVHDGIEGAYAATHRTCHAVGKLVAGVLQGRPLDAMAAQLLPLENGVLNLGTGETLPHGREHRNRWVLPVAYDPKAPAPRWERFLADAVAPAVALFLQEWAGYLLVEGNPHHKMLWLYGPSGTGKSTFLTTLAKLLGPAARAITADNLGPYEVASLAGARLAICNEVASTMLKTTTLKSLVSGDVVQARHPFGRPFSLVFGGKMCWSSNALPPVDQGEGMWRRLCIVQFLRKPTHVDDQLSTVLEIELSGVLNWALNGLQRLRRIREEGRSWEPPSEVTEMVEGYKEAADHFAHFAADEILLLDGEEETEKAVYGRYKYWAENNGLRPRELGPIFWNEMTKLGLTRAEARQGDRTLKVWRGAKLLPEAFG